MSTVTPDQGITLPADADSADAPVGFTNNTAGIEQRLVRRYASIADRTARMVTLTKNDVSTLTDVNRIEIYNGTNQISLYTRSVFTYVRRSAAQVVNNSTVLVNDNTLLSALPTAGTFGFRSIIFYDASTTADIKFAFTIPAGATMEWGINGMATTGAAGVGDGTWLTATASGTAIPVGGSGVGTGMKAVMDGEITMGGTAGNLQLQWAQNTIDATNTSVHAGSRLEVWRSA